jgi:DNA-binding MarR family transcriptional regulator
VGSSKRAADPAREAWAHLYELWFSDTTHEHLHSVCESLDLTPGLMKALLSMDPGEPKPMKALAKQWRCDASYVTALVDGLEERGLAERAAHPTDRRAKLIAMTAEGKRTKDLLVERLHEPPEAIYVLTVAEQRSLGALLAKVAEASG